jgi:hypothetical protein
MKYNKIRPTITASKIGPNQREHVLAKFHNPELVMPNGKSHLRQQKKPQKRQHFKQGHSMTLAAASLTKFQLTL